LTPLIRDPGRVKNQDPDPGSEPGMKNPDHHISESLETILWGYLLKFFDADPGWKKFEFGNRDKKSRIRNTKTRKLIEQDQGCQKSYRLGNSGKKPSKNMVEVLLNAIK
jgi:hypothetical protein